MLIALLLRLGVAHLLARGVLLGYLLLSGNVAPHTLQVLVLIFHERSHAALLLLDCCFFVLEVLHLPCFDFVETLGVWFVARKILLRGCWHNNSRLHSSSQRLRRLFTMHE